MFGQINHAAVLLKDTFGHNESPRKRSAPFAAFLLNAQKDLLKTFEVIMIVPADGRTENLKALLYSKVDTPVGNDDVATLCQGRDHARYCREPLGVQNRGLCSEEVCYVVLKVHVYIYQANLFVRAGAH